MKLAASLLLVLFFFFVSAEDDEKGQLQVIKEQMQAKMSGLSGEAQNIAKKALELIEQGKSGNDIEAEVSEMMSKAPEAVQTELKNLDKEIEVDWENLKEKLNSTMMHI